MKLYEFEAVTYKDYVIAPSRNEAIEFYEKEKDVDTSSFEITNLTKVADSMFTEDGYSFAELLDTNECKIIYTIDV